MADQKLTEIIAMELVRLENEDEIVITCPSAEALAAQIANRVLEIVPNSGLTTTELYGVRSLLLHAVSDKNFFDREMPILTGFSAEEFANIASKMPKV